MEEFENQVSNAYIEGHQLTIMGDCNVDLLTDDNDKQTWLDCMGNFHLDQVINEPTRVTDKTSTLLDHIFTSVPHKIRNKKVPHIGLSDHLPTCIVMKDSFGYKRTHTSIKYRCYKNFNENDFISDLEQVPWDIIYATDDVDDTLSTWHKLFTDVIDRHLPWREKRVKRQKQPDWMTDDILHKMAQRDHFKSINDTDQYRKSRNECVKMIQESKVAYYKSCIENNQGDSKKLWKYLRELSPKEAKDIPSNIKEGDKIITEPSDICEHFNSFFTSIVKKYLPQQTKSPDLTKLQNFITSRLDKNTTFVIPQIAVVDVEKGLKALDIHKATGLDGLSAKILKLSAPAISGPITHILNESITTGKFPTKWKTAKITPIHKSGSHSDTNNFRPISILCTLSKLLERHVHNSLYKYLSDHNLLHKAQSGFRKKHSCETALSNILDTWTQNIEQGYLNGVVFVDLRKAFDLVDTQILLQKLKIYQCNNNSLEWFKSYLQNRKQCVSFKGSVSNTKPTTHGVPQGSILGPLLFIIFMNDLPLNITSHTDMYADDSSFHTAGKTVEELNMKLNSDMENCKTWCSENNMVVNDTKTKTMLVTTYQKLVHLPTKELDVYYDNTKLENVESEKLLGVKIDKHLSWKDQIDKVAHTVSSSIALLRRIKMYLPEATRVMYYKTFLQPHIDYCNTLWGQSNHISRIHKLQKLALRIIYDKPQYTIDPKTKKVKPTPSEPLFKASGTLPIQNRVKLRTAVFVHKSKNGMTPEYITEMFKQKDTRFTRTIDRRDLAVPKANLCVTRKALPYSGAVVYNALPADIKSANTIMQFKTLAYKHYLENYPTM